MENSSRIIRETPTLHYVDSDTKGRAQFAQIAFALGHHCELYDDFSELSTFLPGYGIIIMRDNTCPHGVPATLQRLEELGNWLPVIMAGTKPSPTKIVQAVKSGALDYLTLPIDSDRLERSLARTVNEAEQVTSLRRKKVDAQTRIKKLSPRENQVLDLLVEGQSNKMIARHLDISPRTVEIHRSNMMAKLETEHAAGAVRIKLEAVEPLVAC